jgi:enolase
MIIENVHAREILDSRGNPTVEVEVLLNSINTTLVVQIRFFLRMQK